MRYAVPRNDRQWASWPEIAELPELVAENARLKASHSFDILHLPVADFRRICRSAAAGAAAAYAAELSLPCPSADTSPIVATGHQPEFYHAGVWIKNHLAARLAAAVSGRSVNIIVDNDVPKHAGVLVPVREEGRWRMRDVPLAQKHPGLAFEEYAPHVEHLDEFQRELVALSSETPFEDAAARLAGRIADDDGTGRSLADVTTHVRLSYEKDAGISNAELPISRLAATEPFGAFVVSLAAEAGRFAECHNKALADHRRENRIRNKANPLPDLAVSGDLVEIPFWVWRKGEPRGRAFVRAAGRKVQLYHDGEKAGTLDAESFESASRSWLRLADSGVKIRPRALTTTIFLRMFLADIFIHGIGGAKYDEVTDRVIRSFYRAAPPPFATISATLMLPWPFDPARTDKAAGLRHTIREMDYNPQRYMADEAASAAKALIARKWRLVASEPAGHAGRHEKFLAIREVNRVLAGFVTAQRTEIQGALEKLRGRIADDEVLFNREYSCFLAGPQRAAQLYEKILAPLGNFA